MNRKPRTLPEIRREGFRALVDRLGAADALRFVQQYEPGQGDYTTERHKWLDDVSIDELLAGIEKRRAAAENK
ncbi:MAG: hypothetical protein IT450_20350 [Phycisphaerales bacterium]|nr:hypothetical protein [Phycisphaerales bacterium]